ncbi:alpha/beta hydrolase family protein [Methyloversatilis sp. RAC08]|uniref:alpha/beta fold hydrolase BchO n=1 Tax=Methyloversatilis sp. RAC08 TaxID=1842540 RepID=UPI00083DF33A|nr:alpha/beta fold hydrolase BchO [Methyloversatilis sp. RAC08]AOF80362.1 alpha/beta hydrolase family protein [Methyloversatilis sp. RAC08]
MKALDWTRDGGDWPNRTASRFVEAGGLRWHVQVAGDGPVLLLLHGTGAATHSWRALLPELATRYTVVAPDLPGHGFSATAASHRLTLQGIARALGGLLAALKAEPQVVAGHSAGAAIMLRMNIDGLLPARTLVSLNGAMLPLPGLAGLLFPPAARLLSALPFAPQAFAWRATQRDAVNRLIRSTGSALDPAGVALYHKLVSTPGHVAGALAMMANWDVAPLVRDLPSLRAPLTLVVGKGDETVSPEESRRVHRMIPGSRLVELDGLGHLAHEEAPALAARHIFEADESDGIAHR